MAYQVTFTDATNPAKPSITVEDQALNTQTSLNFVGKNYAGYAPEIAKSFLHLLENFANNTAPSNPVEGQLWYDNSTGVSLLKVFDGTIWTAAGSIKKAGTVPAAANSNPGDLWVDTTTAQLYVFSGSNWLLVGPQFSSGKLTGPVINTIVDTDNVSHSVLSLYANDYQLAIISKETFTPKSTVTGFSIINQGFNLSSTDSTNSSSLSRIWGTAEKADALLVGNTIVPAANFFRTDVSSVTNYPISIRADGGITVGNNLNFNIGSGSDGTSTVLYSKASGNSVSFRLNDNNTPITVLHLAANSRVGIGTNNTSPASTLDVSGIITTSGGLNVTADDDSLSITTGSIITAGGLAVSKKATLGNDVTVNGQLILNYLDSNTGLPLPGSSLLPNTTNIYDIGSSAKSFRNIYAQSFVGNFTGTFTGTLEGSISGSAARLASPTVFSLAGDVVSEPVSFTGQTQFGTAIFNTTLSQNFISNKTPTTDSLATDQMLIYRVGDSNLSRMTKDVFLKHVATVPVGVIFPFAGNVVPTGYLLCDGSEVRTADYPVLYSIIGYTYKAAISLQGYATFALPDFRGRFPLGRDNMNNGGVVSSKDDIGVQISGQPEAAANRVTDVTADLVGTGSGSQAVALTTSNLPDHKHNLSSATAQYYAAGLPGGVSDTSAVPGLGLPNLSTGSGLPNSGSVIAGQLGTAINVMNPYTTINYIIFTGVL
jgi:microcystin-dependent protein